MPFDRDPLYFQQGKGCESGVGDYLRAMPMRREEVYTLEIISVYLQEHLTDSTVDTYAVTWGVYTGQAYTWFDTVVCTSGRWTQLNDTEATFITGSVPAICVHAYEVGYDIILHAVGYVRAPYSSP